MKRLHAATFLKSTDPVARHIANHPDLEAASIRGMKAWNGLLTLAALAGLTGCPGDDTTTPADDGTTTDAATETSSPGTTETTSISDTTTEADTTIGVTTEAESSSSSRGSSSEGETGAGCGNDVIDGAELCDGGDLGGQDCASQGFEGGTLACADDCSGFDTSACSDTSCGNDVIDGDEACDGADLGGQTCDSQGFDGGTLACAEGCGDFDTSACTTSDTGACCAANGTPECENMACTTAVCALDSFCCDTEWDDVCAEAAILAPACDGVSDCPDCGDGVLEMAEVCEDGQLGGQTCEGLGFESGTLGCAADCGGFDTSQCVATMNCCSANTVPECDDAGCTAAICALDPYCCDTEWDQICADAALLEPSCQGVSDCPDCGNGMLEGIEPCDGANLGGETCESQGYDSGTLGCAADCLSLDESACQGDGACCAPNGTVGCEDIACTNAVCNVFPQCCDEPWSQACADVAALEPACQGVTGCPNCGNGELGAGEVCDGANLDGESCASLGLNTGTLACAATCVEFDTTGCFAGGCCESNGSPNCEDAGCTAAICAADPYCCDTEWDQLCADDAAAEPACVGVGGCAP